MKKELAEETCLQLIRINAQLDRQLAKIQGACSDEEFRILRRGFGRVMGHLLTDILNLIYAEHPQLLPRQLGGSYEVDMEALLGDTDPSASNKTVPADAAKKPPRG